MHKCIQCGEETNFMKLRNNKWGCKKCLDRIGLEQKAIKELVLKIFNDYDISAINIPIDNMIEIIKYCDENTSIKTLEHLSNSLQAIKISILYENNMLSYEEKEEIDKKIEEILDK